MLLISLEESETNLEMDLETTIMDKMRHMMFENLSETELRKINRGSERSYKAGQKVGYFLGAMTANLCNFVDWLAENIEEASSTAKSLTN